VFLLSTTKKLGWESHLTLKEEGSRGGSSASITFSKKIRKSGGKHRRGKAWVRKVKGKGRKKRRSSGERDSVKRRRLRGRKIRREGSE